MTDISRKTPDTQADANTQSAEPEWMGMARALIAEGGLNLKLTQDPEMPGWVSGLVMTDPDGHSDPDLVAHLDVEDSQYGPRLWDLALTVLKDVAAADAGQGRQISDIRAERQRQMTEEGFTAHHDDQYDGGELAAAGACYALSAAHASYSHDGDVLREPPAAWPWDASWWKPTNARRDLVKAGALIVAELGKIDRQAAAEAATTEGAAETATGD